MAKKNLLSETQIRRFQSLANISAINEMGSYMKKDDEEEMEEGMYGKPKKDEEEMEEAMHSKKDEEEMEEGIYGKKDDEEAMEEEMDMPEKEMDMDMPEADPDGDGDLDLNMEDAEALIRLADQLKQMLKMEPGEGPEMDMDMEKEDPVGEPAPGMMEEEKHEDEKMEEAQELEEALAGVDFVPEQTDIVQEVARRVAKRLARAKRHQQALDEALGNK